MLSQMSLNHQSLNVRYIFIGKAATWSSLVRMNEQVTGGASVDFLPFQTAFQQTKVVTQVCSGCQVTTIHFTFHPVTPLVVSGANTQFPSNQEVNEDVGDPTRKRLRDLRTQSSWVIPFNYVNRGLILLPNVCTGSRSLTGSLKL